MIQVNLSAVKQEFKLSQRHDWQVKWKRLLNLLGKSKITKKILPLGTILDACGLDDAIEALKTVKEHKNAIRLFACYCARKAVPLFEKRYPDDMRLSRAIDVAEQYARGLASKDSLNAARKSLKTTYQDVCKDSEITDFILEELYYALNPVATCVNAEWFKYTANRELNSGQVSCIIRDSAEAFSYFIKDAVTKENKDMNAAMYANDPSEGFFKAFYSLPALETVNEAVHKASEAAVEGMARDSIRIFEENAVNSPPLTAVKDAAQNAVWDSLCNAAVKGVRQIILEALIDELTVEFRRLCRLEDEYGEVDRMRRRSDNLSLITQKPRG
jgi:hypothetical protein